mmetsp:Transcript_11902/g.51248  ORF Transcript_11902/g.51248 Transcript_11902/m.51248 type:complete len:211 (+) Transcript_11902:1261-1893(+)
MAIGDVRLKLDALLVEASAAVDGERIHVLRRAHVPAGCEDQASLRDQPLIARQVDHLGVHDRLVAVCVLATRRARQALFLTLWCLVLDGLQRLALLPGRISIRGAFELRLERLSGNITLLPSGKLRDDVRASGDRGVLLPGRSRARRDGHLFFSDSLRTRLGDLTARALPLRASLAVVGDVMQGRLFPGLRCSTPSSRAHHRFRPSPPRA